MPAPTFEWLSPLDLLVDETYQRDLSDNSVRLIRKIVGGWDWRRFKPPVVVKTDAGFEVIDGQHTAIAAATHPEITRIPVMLVEAAELAERASAFLGHNRDRIAVTPAQMHYAAVAAGDEDALTVAQVCARAGVKIARHPPGQGRYRIGETSAVGSLGALISRRGVKPAREILQVLVEAGCAPISAEQIRAAEMLLTDAEYSGDIEAADLVTTIIATREDAEREAKTFAAAHQVPRWKALGIVWFKRKPRGRKRAA
ncbi:DUF6551 family protein [Faunimonas pinastri]|nr:DUF6551 family protein [Faunimonas pinastri]